MSTKVFVVIALFALTNGALINLIMASRLVYGMSREGIVPPAFGRVHEGLAHAPGWRSSSPRHSRGAAGHRGRPRHPGGHHRAVAAVVFGACSRRRSSYARDLVDHEHYRAWTPHPGAPATPRLRRADRLQGVRRHRRFFAYAGGRAPVAVGIGAVGAHSKRRVQRDRGGLERHRDRAVLLRRLGRLTEAVLVDPRHAGSRVVSSTPVIAQPSPCCSKWTLASVESTRASARRRRARRDSAIEKQPAWAAPISSSGFVPGRSRSASRTNTAPRRRRSRSSMFPWPSASDPFHSACAVRVGIGPSRTFFRCWRMSRGQRFTFLGIAAVIAVVAVILLAGGGDETEPTKATRHPRPSPTATATADGTAPRRHSFPHPRRRSRSRSRTLLQEGDEKALTFEEGETVRFRVRSDVDEQIHVHGYDITLGPPVGETVTVAFRRYHRDLRRRRDARLRRPARAAEGRALAGSPARPPGHEPGVTKLLQSPFSRYVVEPLSSSAAEIRSGGCRVARLSRAHALDAALTRPTA